MSALEGMSLGDRMKAYERETRTVLPRRTYTILRADGRAFHTYLRGAARPYDYQFMADMDEVARALCEEISGAVFAYVQSDEISVLISDFGGPATQPWFGGQVQKMVSIGAATATLAFARRRDPAAAFDARVFAIADPYEVGSYFVWRQRDAVRNSVTMAAQAQFSHRQLHRVNTDQMQEMLRAVHGIDWSDYPEGARRGRVVVKASGERPVVYTDKRTGETRLATVVRSWWEARPAPVFAAGSLLDGLVPVPAEAD